MSDAAATVEASKPSRSRLRRFVVPALIVLVLGAMSYLLGWNIRGWFSSLWDTITGISPAYLIAGIALQTLQTTATAYAWYWILRYAYPGRVTFKPILACYATAVGLNSILPANLGTLVMLLMFVAVIAGATFAGVLTGYLVHKIFFTVVGAGVYIYLFVSVGGSFDVKFSWIHAHPWATAIITVGVVVLVFVLVRIFRPKLQKLWAKARYGGEILMHPRAYFAGVLLPEVVGYCAMLGVIAVFLAAYGIPVSFHTVMRVVGGNSIANVTSVTPGGVGVNQAFNVASLRGVTSSTNATAYSVAQQLVTTAWGLIMAVLLLIWAFSWSGGRALVSKSYADAKKRAADEKEKRKDKKTAKRAAGRSA
jgi:uncharacterized membrane protein YbhN (UPF0104 family)